MPAEGATATALADAAGTCSGNLLGSRSPTPAPRGVGGTFGRSMKHEAAARSFRTFRTSGGHGGSRPGPTS